MAEGEPESGGGGHKSQDERFEAIANEVADGSYCLSPQCIADALLKHIDPDAYWKLVRAGEIEY